MGISFTGTPMGPGGGMMYGAIFNCKAQDGGFCGSGYISFVRIWRVVSTKSSRFGVTMAETPDHIATGPDDNTSILTRRDRQGSALDRGFPTGKVLLGLVALILLLQGIAAWKVMTLEQERATLARRQALLEREIKDHDYLTRELPGLRSERSEFATQLPALKGELASLEMRRARRAAELSEIDRRAQELRAASEQAEATRSALEKSVGSLKGEIQAKASELGQLKQDLENLRVQQKYVENRKNQMENDAKRLDVQVSSLQTRHDTLQDQIKSLTGPNSDLAKSTADMKTILEELKKSPARVEDAINQVVQGLNLQVSNF